MQGGPWGEAKPDMRKHQKAGETMQIIWPEPSLVSTITHLKAHRSTKAMHPSTPRPSVEQGELTYTRIPTHAQVDTLA